METFDVVVIGAGPGGYPAAIRAAQLGARSVIIEREFLGGTCLNWGCIPTKTLIAAGELKSRMAQAGTFGLRLNKPIEVDYAALRQNKDSVIAKLRGGIQQLLKAHGVTTYVGHGRLVSRKLIEVQGAEGARYLEARHIIIATGSRSVLPAGFPINPRIMESRGFLDLPALPRRLLVVGGGYIGCELACLAAQLGSQVILIELLNDLLLQLDPDIRRELRRHMGKELGIKILTGEALRDLAANSTEVTGRVGELQLSGDAVLIAIGRRPFTEGLNLEAAGLKTNDTGCILTDEFGATNIAGVYAVGDVNGRHQLAHAATSQGIIAVENALGCRPQPFERLVPGVIFTHPEIALVGESEQSAQAAGRAVRVGHFRFSGLGRALAGAESAGFVKWIAEPSGRLIGAQAIGARATELIAEATLAIRQELTAAEVGRTIHAHPTFGEAWQEAARVLEGHCVHALPSAPT